MATKNTMVDLNNLLFEAMERLNDESLTPEELEREIYRSKSMADVAKTIIANGSLALEARKHMDEYGCKDSVGIPLLGIKGGE